ncbi:uncharacterized protein LOC141908822 [Tubulanus polymorphus]|uniref:uncharacterized protein LOC141908822 n=1 Tax=Tubulanus polymorphus TaxID=672921 RepID=UPI003DA351F8
MMDDLFRFAGDIEFSEEIPIPGQIAEVKLKQYSETCNFLQHKRPLTPEHPYFFAQVNSLAANSVITIGIAGPDINDDVHPGNWNNTVGYHSNTGRCYTSHKLGANTDGQKFGINDIFGVLVTYFGETMSTVMFLKNGQPVATRYHFEPNHSNFLPTIALENGPIDLGLMWPEAALGIPKYSEKNMLHWIRSPLVHYDAAQDHFFYDDLTRDELPIQSPFPLSRQIQHFEVVIKETSDIGAANCIAIATCSPIKPTPTCELLRDYFCWHPDGQVLKMKVGERMGWGILYDPAHRSDADFDDKKEQMVLCYVSIDSVIVYHKMMLQPPGGWYPLVLLHPYASKIEIDMQSNTTPKTYTKLDELFLSSITEAYDILNDNSRLTAIDDSTIRASEQLQFTIDKTFCRVKLTGEQKGIHVIQLQKSLTPESCYFYLEVLGAGEDSVISIGVAPSDFALNKYPGKTDGSVGYTSRDGKMWNNNQSDGNTTGRRFTSGDCVGLEVSSFDHVPVILFNKNYQAVGTRFMTVDNLTELFPTVAVYSGGSDVDINIVWQNRISAPPVFQVANVEHWCLPEGAEADPRDNIINLQSSHTNTQILQAPYSLHNAYNHFEVSIVDDFDAERPPPAIGLCTASPIYKNGQSNFKQDFIRFWAVDEALGAVKKGDLMGWGVLFPDEEMCSEELVICYLTINRDVALTRVLFNPPGGLFPLVLCPAGVDRIQMEFGATIIEEHPFSKSAVKELLVHAKRMLEEESQTIADGKDIEEWTLRKNKQKYLRPVPVKQETPTSRPQQQQQRKPQRLEEVETGIWDVNQREQITHFGSVKSSKSCTIL